MQLRNSERERVAWIDVARALGITLVVFGHAERGLMSAGILSGPLWHQIDFAIYTFHMPLFFFLSGMGVRASQAKSGFFARRAKGIVVPYVVFSLLQGGVQIVMAGQTNGELAPRDLLLIPIQPISPFWFLYVLLIYVALVSVFKPGWPLMAVAMVMTALSPLAEGVSFWPLFHVSFWPLFQVLYFFSFYMAGVMFGAPRLPWPIGLAALAVWAVTCFAALSNGLGFDDYYALLMLPAAIGGSIALIWIAQRLEFLGWVSWIGRNVIAIYVMHILAVAGTRIILMGFGIYDEAAHLVLGTSAGIALPLAALLVLQRLKLAVPVGLPGSAHG